MKGKSTLTYGKRIIHTHICTYIHTNIYIYIYIYMNSKAKTLKQYFKLLQSYQLL